MFVFKGDYDKILFSGVFPKSLCYLILGDKFNQSFRPWCVI